MGSLAVARAVGDRDFKYPYNKADGDFVSAEPHIAKIMVTPEDEFLIVSCDGLWDKLSYEEAVDFVVQCRAQGKGPQEAAQLLVNDSLEKGTLDNVTAIIVYFPNRNTKQDNPKKSKKEKNTEKEEKKKPESSIPEDVAKGSKLMDVYEFLAHEVKPKKTDSNELRSSTESPDSSPRSQDKLKLFQLPEGEQLLAEYPCLLEKKMLYQGILLLTPKHLCFYSNFPGKKTKSKIGIKDIQCIEKTKSLIVASAIKITTKDGKKHQFNWKQNHISRDQAFTTLLELMNEGEPTNVTDDNSIQGKEQPKVESESGSESDEEEEEVKQEKNLAFSRFDD